VYQTALAGNTDGFIALLTKSGALQWSTYFGGLGVENVTGWVTDKTSSIYVAGSTSSATGIATPGSFRPTHPAAPTNAPFLVKFDSSGVRQWGTYYGGTASDGSAGCATTSAGDVYITGTTGSKTGIATPGAYQTTFSKGNDIFLARFSSSGTRLWSTYLG